MFDLLQDRFSMNYVFALAFGIGFVAGLRSLTPPAVVAWAAYLGWLPLNNSPLAFMGSIIAVIVFSLFALLELFADLHLYRRRHRDRLFSYSRHEFFTKSCKGLRRPRPAYGRFGRS